MSDWTDVECYPTLSAKARDGYYGIGGKPFDADCPHCGHLAVLHSQSRGCIGCELIATKPRAAHASI